MERMNVANKWILVTGASSGLGWELALQLAREHKAHLIPVARRLNKLEELKAQLASTGVQVDPIAADLSKVEDVDRVFQHATKDGRQVYGAILNAGVTHFGHYNELSWEGYQTMLSTNVTSVVRLTLHMVEHLKATQQGGGLMIVSSMAGLTPIAFQSVYSATKAFLANFGCALAHELEGENLSITVFAPGGIVTEMTSGDRFKTLSGWLMPVDKCARDGLQGFIARKYLHVPGFIYRIGNSLLSMLPRRFVAARVAATYRGAVRNSPAQNQLGQGSTSP